VKRTVVALGLLPIALLGCSKPPTSGTVTEVQYDDPDIWTTLEPTYMTLCQPVITTFNGRTSTSVQCGQNIVGWHNERHYDGPHWRLKLQDDKDPKHTGWVEVSENVFVKYYVGGHYPDAR
jgi:hypothetical protein